ncbi:unnamed protein product [marine sediment metagenome]|uniref:Uncharacterized protein n=1 Tax=marine sediment metagenome TaxID=412755 RepID=X1BYA5_9ZZZZ
MRQIFYLLIVLINKFKKIETKMKNKIEKLWLSNSSEWTEVAPKEQGLDSDKISELFEYLHMYNGICSNILLLI